MDDVLEFAARDDVVDRFGLEEVEGLAVLRELLLLHPQQNRVIH